VSLFEKNFQTDPKSWLDVLPQYQRDIVDELLKSGASYDVVAEQWLAATVAHDTTL